MVVPVPFAVIDVNSPSTNGTLDVSTLDSMDIASFSSSGELDPTVEGSMEVASSSFNAVLDPTVEDSMAVASSSPSVEVDSTVDDGNVLDSPGVSVVLNSSATSTVDVDIGTPGGVLGAIVGGGISMSVDESAEMISLTSVVAGTRVLTDAVNISVRNE